MATANLTAPAVTHTREPHCPFLNRADARCGNHFSLTTMADAFDECFGCYAGCPTYHELLSERRERQEQQGHRPTAMSYPANEPPLVQLRVHL